MRPQLSLLFLALVPGATLAQDFYIPPQHQVRVPGACMWECVESVGRTYGVGHRVHGLAQQKVQTTNGGANQYDVRRELDTRGVQYNYSPPRSYDWNALRQAAPHGAIIGVRTGPGPRDGHAIVVTGVSPDGSQVRFWDPSAPHRMGTVSAQQLQQDWFGDALWLKPQR